MTTGPDWRWHPASDRRRAVACGNANPGTNPGSERAVLVTGAAESNPSLDVSQITALLGLQIMVEGAGFVFER